MKFSPYLNDFSIIIDEYKIRDDGSILINLTILDYEEGLFLYMDRFKTHGHKVDRSQGHVVSTWLK